MIGQSNKSLLALMENGFLPGPSLKDFLGFVDTLTDYTNNQGDILPFSLSKLVEITTLPQETVSDFLQVLTKAFNLFRNLQSTLNKKTTAPAKVYPKLLPKKPQLLRITKTEIELVADFHLVTCHIPIRQEKLNISFKNVIAKYPMFFAQENQCWKINASGAYLADQFIACKKLNTLPKTISTEDHQLEIEII